MFIYSTVGSFQVASFTNGVKLHLSRGWECSTERRSRDRGAAGDPAWMMVADKGGLGEILVFYTQKM